jgi:formate dehydrogenase major subunit
MIVADMDVPFGNSSCISCGTCLQVCPTGALMDRRSAYRGHESEVDRTQSTCAACSVGCGTELVTRNNQLLRVEGNWDAEVNSGILCVAGRFDALLDNRRRALTPMIRRDGQLKPATWEEALDAVAAKMDEIGAGSAAAITTSRTTNETLNALTGLFGEVGSLTPVPDFLGSAEGSVAGLEEADMFLVVGEDLDLDHQVVGIAVRRGVMNRGARLIIVDDGENSLADMAHYVFATSEIDQAIALAQGIDAPAVIYGAGAGKVIDTLRQELGDKAQFLGLVPGTNARGALSAGVNGGVDLAKVGALYVLAADDQISPELLGQIDQVDFVVAQTSYEGPLTEVADVVLPTPIWAEISGTLTNTEGRTQEIVAGLQIPTSLMQDQEILSALGEKLG